MRAALLLFVASLLALLSSLAALPAGAEGTVERQVGPYLLRLSLDHPPRLDDANALLLEVVDTRDGRLVEGLQDSLRMEGWVYPTEGARRYVPVFLRPSRERPGTYEGVFVPPALGPYRFYILGSIEKTPVQEEFATGPGGLPDVLPPEDELLTPGAVVGLVILGLYLAGMAGLGAWYLRQRRRSAATG
ncbi:MAG: hypothetical protein NZ695_04490 [Dehalococcoidia bacterium]|jgi:hypothetical protein|nr:hypothetical protein [Dehalococcoidia bacterium]MDW8008535.1 hypothetical protein [Chloroflexota bacterium]